jgi:translation initiation factor 5
MSKTENIDKNKNDPFYRYKMPSLIIGHRKARTYLENIEPIFACLTKYAENAGQRSFDELMKWFNYQMSANAKDNFLSGDHPDNKLVENLHQYIQSYVLCGACSNPETTLFVMGKTLWTRCKACGKDNKIDNKFSKYNKYLLNLPHMHM